MKENPSPPRKYATLQTQTQGTIETPFKQYPLPVSPMKIAKPNVSAITPSQRLTPVSHFSTLKSVLSENDIFTISPSMFPRKTKQMDYLDIMANAERKDFVSPLKTAPVTPSTKSKPSTLEMTNEPTNPATGNEPIVQEIDTVVDDCGSTEGSIPGGSSN
jgi:hypothetical protein